MRLSKAWKRGWKIQFWDSQTLNFQIEKLAKSNKAKLSKAKKVIDF